MSPHAPIPVLHLRDSPWIDGPGRTILETAARIDRGRIDYHIAPLVAGDGADHPLVVAARARGASVLPVRDPGDSFAALADRVVQLTDRLGIRILHSSEFRTNLVALRCRGRRPALRLVSTAHGWIANDLRGAFKTLIDRMLLKRFDRVILVSNAMRRRLPRWWVPDPRVAVIHNALALDSYAPGFRWRGRERIVAGEPVNVLTVGRLSSEKGLDLLLRAVADLAAGFPGLRLLLAGIGPCEPMLRALAVDLGIRDKVKWFGYVTDMPAIYSQADLVVQSSLTEGLPNVMLETAYLGVPVVATDVGGTREVIEHGVSGWLVEAGSAAALAAGIRRYLESPAQFAAMAARGRRRIVEQFSFEARTAKQMALYEEVAGDGA